MHHVLPRLLRSPATFARVGSVLAILICCIEAHSRVWYVKADAAYNPVLPNAPGNSFPAIQIGADSAFAGDTVLVGQGTYYETIRPKNPGVDSTNGIIYYVYFIAGDNIAYPQGLPLVMADGPAVIKAQDNYCFEIGSVDSIRAVPHYVDYIWIEGFYLTNAFPKTSAHGAAIRNWSNYGVFIGNHIYDNDLGILCEGNGTYAEESNNRGNYIARNVISNSLDRAVHLKHSSENDVVFNLMYHNGYPLGPIPSLPAPAVTFYCGMGNRIINNTMWDNGGSSEWYYGGAIQVYDGTDPESCMVSINSVVLNNIFARPDSGVLLRVDSKTAYDSTHSSVFAYNLFWGPDSTAPLIYWGGNNINEGGYYLTLEQFRAISDTTNPDNGLGSFFADPQFVNVADRNFNLMTGGPAVDRGIGLAVNTPDSMGDAARPPPDSIRASQLTTTISQSLDFGIVDLGYHQVPLMYMVNPPVITRPNHLHLFPNPYSGKGGLQFLLPNVAYPRRLSGQIFNLLGQRVAELRIPDNPLNLFNVSWDAPDLAAGIYILKLSVNGRIYLEKILLMR